MSLGVVVKGPEGLVLAADTRITLGAQQGSRPPVSVNFDNATKLLTFSKPHNWVAAVTYGQAVIGGRTAHSFIPEFEVPLANSRLPVVQFAQQLSEFFQERWERAGLAKTSSAGGGMKFIVGGYDEQKAYGEVLLFTIPGAPQPVPRNPDDFGMTWGGQLQIASRIIQGYDPSLMGIIKEHLDVSDPKIEELRLLLRSRTEYSIPYDILALQDCVDLATFLIRTTMTAQNLAVGVRGVGGTIEVATITRTDGLKWIQKKEIHGENRP